METLKREVERINGDMILQDLRSCFLGRIRTHRFYKLSSIPVEADSDLEHSPKNTLEVLKDDYDSLHSDLLPRLRHHIVNLSGNLEPNSLTTPITNKNCDVLDITNDVYKLIENIYLKFDSLRNSEKKLLDLQGQDTIRISYSRLDNLIGRYGFSLFCWDHLIYKYQTYLGALQSIPPDPSEIPNDEWKVIVDSSSHLAFFLNALILEFRLSDHQFFLQECRYSKFFIFATIKKYEAGPPVPVQNVELDDDQANEINLDRPSETPLTIEGLKQLVMVFKLLLLIVNKVSRKDRHRLGFVYRLRLEELAALNVSFNKWVSAATDLPTASEEFLPNLKDASRALKLVLESLKDFFEIFKCLGSRENNPIAETIEQEAAEEVLSESKGLNKIDGDRTAAIEISAEEKIWMMVWFEQVTLTIQNLISSLGIVLDKKNDS